MTNADRSTTHRGLWLALLGGAFLLACGDDDGGSTDASSSDGGADAGVFDAGDGDSGVLDAGLDAGLDASDPDSGVDGSVDAGTITEPEGVTPISDSRAFLFYDLTSDGRFVAFASPATNLVVGDTNGVADAFVFDRVNLTLDLVSRSEAGVLGNGDCSFITISDDGRYVAFASTADNLVAGDTEGFEDAFVVDRTTGVVERYGATDASSRFVQISDDGAWLTFSSESDTLVGNDSNGFEDVFLVERATGTVTLASTTPTDVSGNSLSNAGSISADGRYLAFVSFASDLVVGETGTSSDVFVFDRNDGSMQRVSSTDAGDAGNSSSIFPWISRDGSTVAFRSFASDFIAGDTNAQWDDFVWDRVTGQVERVSISTAGVQGDGSSVYVTLSSDGRYVAFGSSATNLVAGDTNGTGDIFVRDRMTNETIIISPEGRETDGASEFPILAGDGSLVLFRSAATNWLMEPDTNGEPDLFLAPVVFQP